MYKTSKLRPGMNQNHWTSWNYILFSVFTEVFNQNMRASTSFLDVLLSIPYSYIKAASVFRRPLLSPAQCTFPHSNQQHGMAIHPGQRAFTSANNLLRLPLIISKLEKLPSKSSTGQPGQITKLSNREWGLTPTVTDVEEWKPWSTYYVNVSTILKVSGTDWQRPSPNITMTYPQHMCREWIWGKQT